MSNHFKKTQENFICEKCNVAVVGDGYTNHCSTCLWSKHVDIHPGDRLHSCGGLMKPVQVLAVGDSYILIHICTLCGYEKKNKMSPKDTMETAIEIARKIANNNEY